MKLKKVKVFGFKTFADKTEFDLEGDIVTIVGPNGCGKSNIVDAILWGLGEPNSRAVRAQSSKEVVFAGSVHRKPLGFAEVSITFDNEDGQLHIDTPEVCVTRRVDRSGQSDFAINKKACRLKDVADLLCDSGLGRSGYAIIGQSDIDQALAASPQQRRAWIDEAAGVQRYRMRRAEAVRRLEDTEKHLTRVRDISNELEAQLSPLARESEKAVRYKAALEALQGIESGLLAKQLFTASQTVQRLVEDIDEESVQLAQEREKLAKLELDGRLCSDRVVVLETKISQAREALDAVRNRLGQARSNIELAKAKQANLDDLESNLAGESDSIETRIEQVTLDLAATEREHQSCIEAMSELEANLASSDSDLSGAKSRLDLAEQYLALGRQEQAEEQKARLQSALNGARIKVVQTELDGIDMAWNQVVTGLDESQAELSSLNQDLMHVRKSIEDLNIKRKALEQKLRESESESTALARQIAELDGRKRGIEATLASNEGVSSGSRAVLDLMRQGILQGDVRLLVDGLDVPTMYTAAIDAALGHAVHDLIAMDREAALNAVTHLAEHRLGLATIHVPNVLTDNEEPGFRPTIPGTIGWASALIECEAILKSTIDVLLGDVLVVESLVDADKLLESPGCRAVVSLGGDYVITGSSIAGGKTGRSLGSAVQRKSDAKSLEETIQDLVKQSEGLEAVNQETDAEIKACSASEAKLRSRLDELSTQLSDAKTWHNRIEIELRSMQSAKSKLQSELSTLEQTVLVHVEPVNLQLLEQKRDTAWEAYMKASGATDTIRSTLEALRNDEATKKARATELKGRLASALSARESRNSRVQNLDSARRECRKSIGLLDEELKRLVPIESEHDSSLELLETERKRNMELTKDRQILSDTVRLSIAARESTVHKFELERARHEVQRASLIERLLDDYGLGETQALELARVQTLPKDAASEVAKHRREIRDIGDVNLGAIDAYERMSERHCELRGQLEDIESGAEDIRASIRELDSITTERFESTFELVKEAFSKTFRQLFEGGEGHVILVRGDADQDAGVDIVITLPGKRRQRLELLSGGERALAALAFLFALLAVKPSPLVVLDEVDAPLDGRNVERFVHLMREWSEKIQFILVTHNPMTIESADVWFGVTMQEPGVSTLIPYRLPDKSIVKATVPDRYLKG